MTVIDTSALIAILTNEPDAEVFETALANSAMARISAVNLVEATMVASRAGDFVAVDALNALMASFEIEVMAVDRRQAEIARQAFLSYGRGRGHPAQLNFGDCFSYALARFLDAPLLFKGSDFALTDVKMAL